MSDKKIQQVETAQQREQRHMGHAVVLVLAVKASIDRDKIGKDVWSRMKSALEAGAAAANSFGGLVSVMARKLEIDTLGPWSAERLRGVEQAINDELADFCALLDAQSHYIVAMAQLEASEAWAARQQQSPREPSQGQLDLAPEVTG